MHSRAIHHFEALLSVFVALIIAAAGAADEPALTLSYEPGWLVIHGPQIPGDEIRIHYLEAYCRANSSDADWAQHTVIDHRKELIELSDDKKSIRLRDTISDGVVVDHWITARDDEVDFQLVAHNPGDRRSEVHWAQPCVRLAAFTGFDPNGNDLNDYLPKCFVFIDGRLERMPTEVWAMTARYTPGQVWCPRDVPKRDLNPRPVNQLVPSHGIIGAFSGDEQMLFATAWEPYQELFQGVARCVHSDFRLGGLQPNETKHIRGKIYLLPADVKALLARYERDFPEQRK